jgi:hypothetical protein
MEFRFFKFSIFPLIFSSFLVGGCKDSIQTDENNSIQINLSNSRSTKLSEFFERIDYLLLDYSDEKPIVFPYKMIFAEDRFFVESRETASVFEFNWNGKVEKIIQNFGDGPGEFKLIDGLSLKDSILSLYVRHKLAILKFNRAGKLISEEKVSVVNDIYFGDNFTLVHNQHGEGINQQTFSRYSDHDTLSYLPLKKGHERFYSFASPLGFQKKPDSGQIYFKEENSYSIQVFSQDGYFEKTIQFDFGKYNYPEEQRLQFADKQSEAEDFFKENSIVKKISNFFPFKNGFFMSVYGGPTNSAWIFLNTNLEPQAIIEEFENDLDGSLIQLRTWTQTSDQIVYQINSRKFFNDYTETFNDQEVEIIPGNIHDFFSKNKQKLREEKHVLVFLKVK